MSFLFTPGSAPTLLSRPNLQTIISLCGGGRLKDALLEMAVLGIEVRLKAYDSILSECMNQTAIREGQRVHSHMTKTCYSPPVYLENRLLVFYGKCGWVSDARRLFDEMTFRNVVTWAAMTALYSQRGHAFQALSLFVQSVSSGVHPNEHIITSALSSCLGSLGFYPGRQIHGLIIKANFENRGFVGSKLLDVYAKSGRIMEARRIFEGMSERDVVCCTTMIAGYAQLGLDVDALELYSKLLLNGGVFNSVTYANVLTAVSGLAALDYGKQIHGYLLRSELPFIVVLRNSLVDMYSKCGWLVYARRVFDQMPERTASSWNSMLVGYAKHGMGKEVAELFQSMREDDNVQPNDITLQAVLSGCSHAGMISEGVEIFEEMAKGMDRVVPTVNHYGCIVDLLGRAGQVERAFEFIQRMPMKPVACIWESLLGACKTHDNVDVGEIAGHRLLRLEPDNGGHYVILSNLYASAGRWEDARLVRELMTVTKDRGRSYVDLDRTVHT